MFNKYSILYAEDEYDIRELYSDVLQEYFKDVYKASDGIEAFEVYKSKKPDVVLLDVNMPRLNGIDLAKKIRIEDSRCKIIVLSAISDQNTLLNACEVNLLKYLLKPIKTSQLDDILVKSITELEKSDSNSSILSISEDIKIDKNSILLYDKNKKVKLTKNEMLLLTLLVKTPGAIVQSEDILNYIWGDDVFGDFSSNRLRVLIYRLNKKLSEEIVMSVYGSGYFIKAQS